MNMLWQDVHYGLRALRKSPGFTAIAVLTLALGIGANTAIFSAVNAVLLRSLPFRAADRLVMIWETHPSLGNVQAPYPDFRDWRIRTKASGHTAFDDLAAYTSEGLQKTNLTGEGQPELLKASLVSANLLPLIGTEPPLGRNFLPDEEIPGHDRVVLISHSLWMRKLGGNASVLGRNLQLDGAIFRVVGVLPAGRALPGWADVLLPISQLSDYDRANRKHHQLEVVGRLKTGATLAQGQAEMAPIAHQLEVAWPATNNTIGVRLMPIQDHFTGESRKPLLILFGTVGLILLIACANVANLMLARGAIRHKEITIRAALGASRGRLIRQLLTESIVLALAGGMLGWLLAVWSAPFLRIGAVDPRVLAFTLAASLLTGILFGLLPAWRVSRADLNSSLREGRTSGEGSQRPGLRNALVAGEVATAIVVLVAAGLLIRSFGALLRVDPGFRPDHILTAHISLSGLKYSKPGQAAGFYQTLLPKLSGLPGVEGAASIAPLPFTTALSRTRFAIAGSPLPEAGRFPVAQVRTATTGYFQALRIPLRRGRFFNDADMNKSVLIVNEALARRYFPDRDPIGRKILLGVVDPNPVAIPIAGVVGDTREIGLSLQAEPELYFPGHASDATLVVRTSGDPMTLAAAVRRTVVGVDREQPLSEVRTMEDVVGGSLARQKFAMLLLILFSVLALLLAAVGLYGVVSYSVAQRTREMGLRMALGAGKWDIFRLVLQQGMTATALGIAAGTATAVAVSRLLSSLLYQVSATDLPGVRRAPWVSCSGSHLHSGAQGHPCRSHGCAPLGIKQRHPILSC